MNILIISNFFYPNNRIASFRINAFAKYFNEAGHSVTVITEGEQNATVQWHGCEIHYLKDPVSTPSQRKKLIIQNKRWKLPRIIKALESRITLDPAFIWRFKALKEARRLCQANRYDVVLSSYGLLSPHMITLRLRKDGFKFLWVADMRDEISKAPMLPRILAKRLAPVERTILKTADLITSVSKPIIDDFKSIGMHDRFLEIKNGYDYNEILNTNFQPRFTMAYIGTVYGMCTPDSWFRAFAELLDEQVLPDNSLIRIIGSNRPIEVPPRIAGNVISSPEVPHDEAIRISAYETDLLVLMHRTGRKGVYSGKIFDYLATNKPILALYDPDDVVAQLLEETKAGFTVDYDDIAGIKQLITQAYRMWQNRQVLPRDWAKIKQYSRRHQTYILIDHLEKMLDSQPAFGEI